MTTEEATQIRKGHDDTVRILSRMTKTQLQESVVKVRRIRGEILVYGGPQSKDELIGYLLDSDGHTVALQNEAIHVLHHKPGENWSACEHCQTASVTA